MRKKHWRPGTPTMGAISSDENVYQGETEIRIGRIIIIRRVRGPAAAAVYRPGMRTQIAWTKRVFRYFTMFYVPCNLAGRQRRATYENIPKIVFKFDGKIFYTRYEKKKKKCFIG